LCGIFGCLLEDGHAAKVILEGLKKLEYRGYDSVGIATLDARGIHVKKDKGKIAEVEARLSLSSLPGNLGIGHTRWATHGAPSQVNAHPHTDCTGTIAVVHNGVIENFMQLRSELEGRGHKFKSATDTEVIAHLVEEGIARGLPFLKAVIEAVKVIDGSYAIAVISVKEPDTIICARKESPLVIGIGDRTLYCASDIPAILPYTRKVAVIEDGEVVVLSKAGFKILKLDGTPVSRAPFIVQWSAEEAERGGYPHFMLKEIFEQPLAIKNTLRVPKVYLKLSSTILSDSKRLFLVAAGTSYHAGLAVSSMLSSLAHISSTPVIASEFISLCNNTIDEETVVLAISQSGETADTLSAVRCAKEQGAKILSITNVVGSSITRLSDIYICTQAGPEVGVAATKTFTTQLTTLALLAIHVSMDRGLLTTSEVQELLDNLHKVPGFVDRTLKETEPLVKKVSDLYCNKNSFYFLGRGISVATALEGALKLKEISYIHAEGYPAGESKHGPIALIEDGFPCVFVAPPDETRANIVGNIMEMKARGAHIIALASEDDKEIEELSTHFLPMPREVYKYFTPIVYITPLQLLAYYSAVTLGYDPDKPRNLAKSVTVL